MGRGLTGGPAKSLAHTWRAPTLPKPNEQEPGAQGQPREKLSTDPKPWEAGWPTQHHLRPGLHPGRLAAWTTPPTAMMPRDAS